MGANDVFQAFPVSMQRRLEPRRLDRCLERGFQDKTFGVTYREGRARVWIYWVPTLLLKGGL